MSTNKFGAREQQQQLSSYGATVVVKADDDGVEETEEPWVKTASGDMIEPEEEGGSPQYRDLPFSIAFVLHLGVMVFLAIAYGTYGSIISTTSDEDHNNNDNTASNNNHQNANDEKEEEWTEEEVEAFLQTYLPRIVLCLVIPTAVLSLCFSYIGTAWIIPSCPNTMVASSLMLSLFWTVLIALSLCKYTYVGCMLMVGITAYYITIVWKLIPFAACNLAISLKGISANWGMYILAIFFSILGFGWFMLWLYVANGVLSKENNDAGSDNAWVVDCDDDGEACAKKEEEEGGVLWGTLFLLLVSLYWTSTVLLNTIQVTVAGVMGTWCYAKTDATSCCSPAVLNSFYRSVTYSFGSICMGSLLEAIVTALRVLASMARDQARNDDNCGGGGAILLCLVECILRLLEDIIEYFNRWAYVFVGIYGYGYLESGKRVMELFRAKGWTALITYDLVGYVLNLTNFTVGVMTGFVGILIEWMSSGTSEDGSGTKSYLFGDADGAGYWALGIGFITGLTVSSIMMNVIKGAVNTLIVCFADGPAKLEENHPKETQQMASAWVSVFPDCGVRVVPSRASYDVVV